MLETQLQENLISRLLLRSVQFPAVLFCDYCNECSLATVATLHGNFTGKQIKYCVSWFALFYIGIIRPSHECSNMWAEF